MKAILSNLGFVMQLSGLLMLIPLGVAYYYTEMVAIIALLVTALVFLGLGFMMNILCERKELSYKGSCTLFVFVFIFLSFVGAIPYYFVNISHTEGIVRITDSIFESVSGYTTTGFSFITDFASIPKSIIFYRGITQFIGGIGVVLVLLAFFYPEEKLDKFAKQMGFMQSQNAKIKSTFFIIFLIYTIYSVGMIGIAYLLGYKDLTITSSLFFSAVSTGGFSTQADMAPLFHGTWLGVLVIITMILGASNFMKVSGLIRFKFKEFFRSEVPAYLIIMILASTILFFMTGKDIFTVVLHTVSAMTNAGFGYISLADLGTSVKVILSVLMFIGGTTLSTAGGIKIFRLFILFLATRKVIIETLTERNKPLTVFGREYSDNEIVQVFVIVILMTVTLGIGTFMVASYGFSLTDSLFEVSSAITNTGLSVNVILPSSLLSLKWLFIGIMLLGRVEVFSFLIMISFYREPTIKEELTTIN